MSASELIGDAALILQGVGNRHTVEFDSSHTEKMSVNSIVAEKATDYDLASNWLKAASAAVN